MLSKEKEAGVEARPNNEREERKRVREELGKVITQLLAYVKPRHNVHSEIKRLVNSVHNWYDTLAEAEEGTEQRDKQRAQNRTTETQTSPGRGRRPGEVKEEKEVSEPKELPEKARRAAKKKKKKESQREAREEKNEAEPASRPRAAPDHVDKPEERWQTVGPKKRRPPHLRRTRPGALVVKAKEGATYADILKRMKEAPELKELGTGVVKIRRNGTGDLLLQLNKIAEQKVQHYQRIASEKLGAMAEVKASIQESVLELRDLDELTTEEDIREAFKGQLEGAQDVTMEVKNLRKAYGCTQTAVIAMPADAARKAIALNKIRIGWVVCRIREKQRRQRCFRCLEFGHLARVCTGPDRSKQCYGCREEGHSIKSCWKNKQLSPGSNGRAAHQQAPPETPNSNAK